MVFVLPIDAGFNSHDALCSISVAIRSSHCRSSRWAPNVGTAHILVQKAYAAGSNPNAAGRIQQCRERVGGARVRVMKLLTDFRSVLAGSTGPRVAAELVDGVSTRSKKIPAPRIQILPSPNTSYANPTRGAKFVGYYTASGE